MMNQRLQKYITLIYFLIFFKISTFQFPYCQSMIILQFKSDPKKSQLQIFQKHNQNQQMEVVSSQHQAPHHDKFTPSKELQLIGWNDETDSKKKVTAVVISIRCGDSLDHKYHHNTFTSAESNQKVLIAAATDFELLKIVHLLRGDPVGSKNFKVLRKAITQVAPSKVVINWENSSGFSSGTFLSGKQVTFELISKAIERGYTQIFSGYSLMTLLQQWDPKVLGESVFSQIQIQENNPVSIKFDLKALENESSDRLNAMGDILESDTVVFHPKKFSCKFGHKLGSHVGEQFQMRVVSINTTYPSPNQKQNVAIGGVQGSYGHVVLEYKSHGRLIFSAANFSQLQTIKVSNEKLYKSMQTRKGKQYSEGVQKTIESSQNKETATTHAVVEYLKSLLPC